MTTATCQSKHQQGCSNKANNNREIEVNCSMYDQYVDAKDTYMRNRKFRICNDNLNDLKIYFHSFQMDMSASNCTACGQCGAHWIGCLCNVHVHCNAKGETQQCKISCAANNQIDSMFGLLKCDVKLLNQKMNWMPPIAHDMEKNHKHITNLKRNGMYKFKTYYLYYA